MTPLYNPFTLSTLAIFTCRASLRQEGKGNYKDPSMVVCPFTDCHLRAMAVGKWVIQGRLWNGDSFLSLILLCVLASKNWKTRARGILLCLFLPGGFEGLVLSVLLHVPGGVCVWGHLEYTD